VSTSAVLPALPFPLGITEKLDPALRSRSGSEHLSRERSLRRNGTPQNTAREVPTTAFHRAALWRAWSYSRSTAALSVPLSRSMR
jgi:hypothetical protein